MHVYNAVQKGIQHFLIIVAPSPLHQPNTPTHHHCHSSSPPQPYSLKLSTTPICLNPANALNFNHAS